VTTSGALDRGATESLTRSGRDRSNTNLNRSDPRIGQNPRDARGSIDKVDRSDRDSVITGTAGKRTAFSFRWGPKRFEAIGENYSGKPAILKERMKSLLKKGTT
jgi:hypothetical protein